MSVFKGKTIVIGVTGGIAAYKIPNLVSMLVKQGADVQVILTKNATQFIPPIPFESLTGHKCLVDTFDRNFTMEVEHVSLGKKAQAVLIAPATANIIGKLAGGIADDMLSTTVLACRCPMLISPAMNTRMYENPIVQRNLQTLREFGYTVIDTDSGRLACGDTGKGKMPEPQVLYEYLERSLTPKDLEGKKVLVTAGPTVEALDPVRYLTNHSSGKMGYAIARAAMLRGAEVTLVSGPTALVPPPFVKVVNVFSAQDMYDAVMSCFEEQDVIIKAAAVADYTPAVISNEKIKKSDGELCIPLMRTKDILKKLGELKKSGQFLCGFSMETENMLENSREKLKKKNLDMIAANNVKVKGAGFAGDTNVLTLITSTEEIELPLMSKAEAANCLMDEILKRLLNK